MIMILEYYNNFFIFKEFYNIYFNDFFIFNYF